MPTPILTYNASTGSDTASSGSPTTAIANGTNGDIDNAANSTITLNETVDFTGVANDGSDVVWFDGNAGDKHLFAITSFTGGVLTCTALVLDGQSTAVRTASNWAVGGKRASLERDTSNFDVQDARPGWIFEFEDTANFNSAGNIEFGGVGDATGEVILRNATGASPVFTCPTANVRIFNQAVANGRIVFDGLTFRKISTNASNAAHDCIRSAVQRDGLIIRNCTFLGNESGAEMSLGLNMASTGPVCIENNTFDGFQEWSAGSVGGSGIYIGGGSRTQACIRGNTFKNCEGPAIDLISQSSFSHCVIIGNVFYGGGDDGITCDMMDDDHFQLFVMHNTFDNFTGMGLNIADAAWDSQATLIHFGNVYTRCGTGVNITDTSVSGQILLNDYNGFGSGGLANTTDRTNISAGDNDVSGDSLYVSTATPDYTPASGSALAAAIAQRIGDGTTVTNLDIGAVQSGGGGGGMRLAGRGGLAS